MASCASAREGAETSNPRMFCAPCTLSGWNRFLMSLNFDKPLEFNEGDIGLAGMSAERHILSS